MKKSLCQRRCHQREHIAASGGFTKNRDIFLVATKVGDVIGDPLQCRNHVEVGIVAAGIQRVAVGRAQRGVTHPAEKSQPIVDRHHDDLFATCQQTGVIGVSRTDGIAATVNPDHYRKLLCVKTAVVTG